ncbi:hypothetical protein JG687_00016018 [Phytophthora cactorum]|uniref:Uncharacterized protein n=1 Tax=Phytophthora cactorum TaxID=29920 RepID=A0A8T1TTD9_9STRA|nr:hypothetical protein JG687_00016018 [Phytophthora cactorum]
MCMFSKSNKLCKETRQNHASNDSIYSSELAESAWTGAANNNPLSSCCSLWGRKIAGVVSSQWLQAARLRSSRASSPKLPARCSSMAFGARAQVKKLGCTIRCRLYAGLRSWTTAQLGNSNETNH